MHLRETVLWASLVATACSNTPPRLVPGTTLRQPNTLKNAITAVTGDAPRDCGVIEGLKPTVSVEFQANCISDSVEQKLPFVARREPFGVDSQIVHVLTGNAKGDFFYFFYDSSPCGATDCGERLVKRECANAPAVGEDEDGIYYDCEERAN